MFIHKKILMVMPERLGDTLMCTPAIHYLKQYYPTISIDIIALSNLAAETLKNNPSIDQVYVLPSEKWIKHIAPHYDLGINLHDGLLARYYFKLLKVPVKHLPPKDPQQHQAEQALQFIRSLLPGHPDIQDRRYCLYPSQEDQDYIHHLLKQHRVDDNQTIFIGCQIGCHSIAKKRLKWFKKLTHVKVWSFEYIESLAAQLTTLNPHIRLIITGSKSEYALGKKLCKRYPRIINLINQTSVTQLRALMDVLDLFITPDTGLLHVACSSNVPLIALFGPTQLQRTGPYPEREQLIILQGPTMSDISVDAVLCAIKKLLNL